ncbi:MAG TPA: NAD-dependent epimerase/dehydratase family protein [Nitrospira sp.]|jgi:UDP-2-acetamido-2,6-beta-L-arabino-hexul-4-ose reductase|nr:NAD-dependent epimerase/dehydratase family protein [Nitrospira sp.]HNI68194.1 NAD-dependent epimerase/dehydratase family protein [Nitrospira sp.]HNL88099.1 NAD-dependent epimerase/dehydratase family protein [Nitrospira sp.]HNN40817.1 NAD-dependent epimerase/dehydratase family protein [Nitrospira sp.]
MKIGVTGSDGLLGFHIRAFLHASKDSRQIRLANRATFQDAGALDEFVSGLDALIHCAGMNRGGDAEVERVNCWLAETLIASLERTGAKPRIVFANSTHFDRDTGYGRGKRKAGEQLVAWGGRMGVSVSNVILPHIFGEFGRPFYNSVVSTFCHQLANGETPCIHVDGGLELVHAQEVAELFMQLIRSQAEGEGRIHRIAGQPLKVSELLELLNEFRDKYEHGIIPAFRDVFQVRLFNVLRSYKFPQAYPRRLALHSDARGSLFEAVKSEGGGQTFLSSTGQGITRGNHFHLRKVERFLVIDGEGEIRLRRLFSNDVISFRVTGRAPSYVDIPNFYTHSITNVGDGNLQTLFWTNEIFNPADSDTFPEIVLP